VICPQCRARLDGRKPSHRSAWMMVGGGVLVLVALILWVQKLKPDSAKTIDEIRESMRITPDGTKEPGKPVKVPFGEETCVPWHVSAAQDPPPKDKTFLVVTSRVVDPYGLVLSGFGFECGDRHHSLILENLQPGKLKAAVEKSKPVGLVAVGKQAFDLARKETGLPVLFARISNPVEAGLTGDNLIGVSPWVPVEPLMRHLLTVLPSKEKLAVLAPVGDLAEIGRAAADIARKQGRKVLFFELQGETDLDNLLGQMAKAAGAWIVLPDRKVINQRVFNYIQVAAEKAKIPIGVSDEDHVRRGALVGVGPDNYRIGRQLCRLAGALSRDQLPQGSRIFCPEYTFGAIHQATAEKLGYMLGLKEIAQAKLYKWH
jgi:hypothetical protein